MKGAWTQVEAAAQGAKFQKWVSNSVAELMVTDGWMVTGTYPTVAFAVEPLATPLAFYNKSGFAYFMHNS